MNYSWLLEVINLNAISLLIVQSTESYNQLSSSNLGDNPRLLEVLGKGTSSNIFDDRDLIALNELPVAEKWYPANYSIVSQGEWTNVVYIVRSGWCSLQRVLPDGSRHVLDFGLAGDVVGFHSALGINYKTLLTITDTSVFEISVDHLAQAVLKSPRLSMVVMERIVRQRAVLMEHFINVGRRSASVRIIHLLLELGLRAGSNIEEGKVQFFCPLTQTDLADALGLTTIHVNRMLKDLRERDLLLFRNNEVVFPNRALLVQLSNFDEHYLDTEMFSRAHFAL